MMDAYKRKIVEYALERLTGPWERGYIRSRVYNVLSRLKFDTGEVNEITEIGWVAEGIKATLSVEGPGGKMIIDAKGTELETILTLKLSTEGKKLTIWANYTISIGELFSKTKEREFKFKPNLI